MKWVGWGLLVLNALVWFGIDYWEPAHVKIVAAEKTLPRVATLKVDSEHQDEGSDPAPTENQPAQSSMTVSSVAAPEPEPVPEPPPVTRVCVKLGWFETAEKARDIYQSLGRPGALKSVSEEERALEPLHWVIIPPQPEDKALSLFNELQRRGIDSYLVTRGENTNAISLGLFQSRDAAERVLKAKKRQNLNAVLANFPRNQLSYALVFEVARNADQGTGEGRVRDYRDDFEMVEISGCEGIATTPENP
ncbi:hypothetical protein [Marinobacter sp. CHS3-4]|uniref:SPOR domain-containing protein n=1 Tax=Marinobacter sp. CHS3-4 TaxID=3045174 RepID=UPI0024B4BF6A|nr:hypothetical protein [Marinobacter sp. CHS3-4]MDI9246621.1 SPOR domain-containing protein [Marinobacter sp. CHS3-4]